MSTRIVRAPVRTQQGNTPQDAKGTNPSTGSAPGSGATAANVRPAEGQFETHSGHDPLLNRGQTSQVRSPLKSAGKAQGGVGQSLDGSSGEARERAKGGGETRGKRALALLGGTSRMKLSAKDKAKSKASAKAKGKGKAAVLTEQSAKSELQSKQVKAKKAQIKKTPLPSKGSKAVVGQGKQAANAASAASGKGKALTAQGASAGKVSSEASLPGGQAKEGKGASPSAEAGRSTVASSATLGSSLLGEARAQTASPGESRGHTASKGAMGQGSAAATLGRAGSFLQAGGERAASSLGKPGGSALQGKGAEGASAGAPTGAAMAPASESKQSVSLQSLMLQGAKEADSLKRADRKSEAESPRQQFRQLVKQWASAAEANVLQNLQAAMPNDVAAIAWKLASLAQSGVLPKGELMSMISKILKKTGGKKQIDRIKALLVKKGMVAAGVSSDTLALIAAMVALYLGKQGNIDADDLIEELFGMPSRGLDFVLPEGGGSFHDEGREQQAHDDHASGKKLSDVASST